MRSAWWRSWPWLGQLRVKSELLVGEVMGAGLLVLGVQSKESQNSVCVGRMVEPTLKHTVRRGKWLEMS